MIRMLGALLSGCLFPLAVTAQGWTAYGGAGISYDWFLRDREVTKDKVGWPFQVGAGILGGVSYYTANGFNVFGDINGGITRIQFPVPGVSKTRNAYEVLYTRLMLGSGPRIDVGDKGNFITPFIQLGIMATNSFGATAAGTDDQNVRVYIQDDVGSLRWAAVAGAGVDWQFKAIVPSSINLQCSYTPLNLFEIPVTYKITTASGNYERRLQGKLLQIMLSYKVHFWVRHTER